MDAEERAAADGPAGRGKPSRLERFRAWWNLPRGIGLAAAFLGLAHYLPLPALSVPGLLRLHADLAPELVGLGLTLLLIDWAVEERQKAELKAQLIRQMGSRHNDVADTAIRELAHHEWLYNGSLKGANLEGANLRNSNLERAVLSQVNLSHAKLINAWMLRANLDEAILIDANLSGASLPYAEIRRTCLLRANLAGASLSSAHLNEANLQGANFTKCRLEIADLQNADLTGADLKDARLRGANLQGTMLTGIRNWTIEQLEKGHNCSRTIMPDGERLESIPREISERQSRSFAEWKAQYLAQHGGDETTPRDTDKSTNDAPTEH